MFDTIRLITKRAFAGAITSDIIGLVFCFAWSLTGYGLLRRWHWARLSAGVLCLLLLLYCLSYLLMVGLEFGPIALAGICGAVLVSLYSLGVILIVRPTKNAR